MRNIDATGRKLCEIQARLFEESLVRFSGSSPVFVRRFLFSDIAKSFDNASFLFLAVSDDGVFSLLEKEFGATSYGSKRFTANELHWIGYLYRYWAYTQEIPSKSLLHMCPSEEMASFYEPLHTQDPQAALESILEARGLFSKDLDERTLELLRRQKER